MTRTTRAAQFERIADLLHVEDAELTNCLNALKSWVRRQKAMRRDAERLGRDPNEVVLEPFTWRPKVESQGSTSHVGPETDITELGLRPSAVHQLRALNIFKLEDLAEATSQELRGLQNVGNATVSHLRDLLRQVGLDFKENANERLRAYERALVAQSTALEARKATLTDASQLSDVGLPPRIVDRCLTKGIRTLGDLRARTLRDLFSIFGDSSLRQILQLLDELQLPLHSNPGQLERWRFGAIAKDDLQRPDDGQPVEELRPWLGAEVKHLKNAGYKTIGEVRLLALRGGADIRFIGPHGWQRIATYFSAATPPRGRRR